jgi:hypothetical protein
MPAENMPSSHTGNQVGKYKPYYDMVAEMFEHSVKAFNKGDVAQKRKEASFYRSWDCAFYCDLVNAKPEDFIKNRLNCDPFDESTWPEYKKKKQKGGFKGEKVTWDGITDTYAGWAKRIGETKETLRSRKKKYGVCAKMFYKGNLSGYKGE